MKLNADCGNIPIIYEKLIGSVKQKSEQWVALMRVSFWCGLALLIGGVQAGFLKYPKKSMLSWHCRYIFGIQSR
jgi:hypothetical protein